MKAHYNRHLNEYNYFKKNIIKLNKTKSISNAGQKLEKERETFYDKGKVI